MKRILIIGEYEDAKYHPLTGVDELLCSLFPQDQITCSDDYDSLLYNTLSEYDICLSYTDCWDNGITDGQADGIERFVREGGRLIAIHNGISIAIHDIAAKVTGGRFINHPKQQELIYTTTRPTYEPFTLFEEPYQMELHSDTLEITAHYRMDGIDYPAVWINRYGAGLCVFIQPGHNLGIVSDSHVKDLILWAVNEA